MAILWTRVPDGRFAPIRTPIGSEPEKATMQLLHQICRSRIDRLNAAGVMGGSSGQYGDQQRFSASTRSAMSSERQKRYADKSARSHLVQVAAVRRGFLSGRGRGRGGYRLPRR